MMSQQQARRVGGDWVETQTADGRTYYANLTTKATSWEFPAELSQTAAGWNKKLDTKSGRVYYYNKSTQQSSWTKPEGFVDPEQEQEAEKKRVQSVRQSVAVSSSRVSRVSMGTAAVAASAADRFANLRKFKRVGGGESKSSSVASGAALSPAGVPLGDGSGGGGGGGRPLEERVEELILEQTRTYANPGRTLADFARARYNLRRKGLSLKETNLPKLMSFKTALIRRPLMSLGSQELNDAAVQSFKNIVSYMGDRESSKGAIGHARTIIKNTLNLPIEINDETYCQLMKQTTGNPDIASRLKGWELLAICTGVFPPSPGLRPFLESFFADAITHGDGFGDVSLQDSMDVKIGLFARYCSFRLKRTIERGQRFHVPCDAEFLSVRSMAPVMVRVFFVNGSFVVAPVESWTTVADVKKLIAAKLGILSPIPFGLFEATSREQVVPHPLDPIDRVLDVISDWQGRVDRERESGGSGDAGSSSSLEMFRLLFKMRFCYPPHPSDSSAIHMLYIQIVHAVITSRYPLAAQDCVTLGALQLQHEFGDYDAEETGNPLTSRLHLYFPSRYLGTGREREWEEKIMDVYRALAGYTKLDCEKNYSDHCKEKSSVYGAAFYPVTPKRSNEFPSTVDLAIAPHSLSIVDPHTKDTLYDWKYNEVAKWGHSQQNFVLCIGNTVRHKKYYFHTKEADDINHLITAYANHLAGKDVMEQGRT